MFSCCILLHLVCCILNFRANKDFLTDGSWLQLSNKATNAEFKIWGSCWAASHNFSASSLDWCSCYDNCDRRGRWGVISWSSCLSAVIIPILRGHLTWLAVFVLPVLLIDSPRPAASGADRWRRGSLGGKMAGEWLGWQTERWGGRMVAGWHIKWGLAPYKVHKMPLNFKRTREETAPIIRNNLFSLTCLLAAFECTCGPLEATVGDVWESLTGRPLKCWMGGKNRAAFV